MLGIRTGNGTEAETTKPPPTALGERKYTHDMDGMEWNGKTNGQMDEWMGERNESKIPSQLDR